jgi:hypothetical protein
MTTLTVDNLLYEELIMLQDIMMMLNNIEFTSSLDATEQEIFNDLYEKILNS